MGDFLGRVIRGIGAVLFVILLACIAMSGFFYGMDH